MRRAAYAGLIVLLLAGLGFLLWSPWTAGSLAEPPDREPTHADSAPGAAPVLQGSSSPKRLAGPGTEEAPATRDAASDIPDIDRFELTVLDLATEAPAPGVRVVWLAGRTSLATGDVPGTTSDERGKVTVPGSNLSRLAVGDGWVLLRRAEEAVRADRMLHVVRTIKVSVQVNSSDRPYPNLESGVRVSVLPAHDESVDLDRRPARFSTAWWQLQGWWRGAESLLTDAQGCAHATVPWTPRLVVQASAPGCNPCGVEVAVRATDRTVAAIVELVEARTFRARVWTAESSPTMDAHVRCYGKQRFKDLSAVRAWAQRMLGPYDACSARVQGDGTVVAIVSRAADVMSDGSYATVLLPLDELTVRSFVSGLPWHVRSLRPGMENVELEIRMPPRPASPVPILRGGKAVSPHELRVLDVTDPDLDWGVEPEERDGAAWADLFVLDRAYVLFDASRREAWRVRWDGRAALELDELERESRLPPGEALRELQTVVIQPTTK